MEKSRGVWKQTEDYAAYNKRGQAFPGLSAYPMKPVKVVSIAQNTGRYLDELHGKLQRVIDVFERQKK